MHTVFARLTQPAWLLVVLVAALLVVVTLILLANAGTADEHLVAPFRWETLKRLG
jgi:hypothetical protein